MSEQQFGGGRCSCPASRSWARRAQLQVSWQRESPSVTSTHLHAVPGFRWSLPFRPQLTPPSRTDGGRPTLGASAQMPALAHMQPQRRNGLLTDVAGIPAPPGAQRLQSQRRPFAGVNEGEPLSGERVSVSAQSCFSFHTPYLTSPVHVK